MLDPRTVSRGGRSRSGGAAVRVPGAVESPHATFPTSLPPSKCKDCTENEIRRLTPEIQAEAHRVARQSTGASTRPRHLPMGLMDTMARGLSRPRVGGINWQVVRRYGGHMLYVASRPSVRAQVVEGLPRRESASTTLAVKPSAADDCVGLTLSKLRCARPAVDLKTGDLLWMVRMATRRPIKKNEAEA